MAYLQIEPNFAVDHGLNSHPGPSELAGKRKGARAFNARLAIPKETNRTYNPGPLKMSTPGPSSAKYRPSASAATSASTGQVAKADSSSSGSGFTAEMRDRQARGKDPYVKEADQDDEEEDDDEEEEDDEMMDDEEEEDEEDDDMDVDADDEDEESARDERGNRRLRLGRGYVFIVTVRRNM